MNVSRIVFFVIIVAMLGSMVMWAVNQFRATPGESLNMPTDRTAPLEAQLDEMLPYSILIVDHDDSRLRVDLRVPADDLRRIDADRLRTVCNIGVSPNLLFVGMSSADAILESWRFECS